MHGQYSIHILPVIPPVYVIFVISIRQVPLEEGFVSFWHQVYHDRDCVFAR